MKSLCTNVLGWDEDHFDPNQENGNNHPTITSSFYFSEPRDHHEVSDNRKQDGFKWLLLEGKGKGNLTIINLNLLFIKIQEQ